MEGTLAPLKKSESLSLYEAAIKGTQRTRCFVASTPQTQSICNDPFVTGLRYTQSLSVACAETLRGLAEAGVVQLAEDDTTVLHILRGGLNFGLREALGLAFGWNDHPSAFISAQRARRSPSSEDWIISESDYKKIHLLKRNNIVFGDVVATGTSLEFALQRIRDEGVKSKVAIESLVFFTIGGPRSHEILSRLSDDLTGLFPSYRGAVVVYLEGIFAVASQHSPLSIKIDGTDLLRREALLAPEFIASQYLSPTYPIERCTIYDAGSRAFDPSEYFHDIADYWRKTQVLAEQGMTYAALLKERFPELAADRFGSVNLKDLCARHLSRIPASPNACAPVGHE
ncbi:MAG: phosphoribosyltransferase [Proteobacteria bacterium]|nr:phosphoribosyltransferase [Pseudomonadota bacterium]